MASMEDTDENIVSEILLQLPVLIAESESRRYCVRVKWGNRKRRSTRFPNPEKTEASGSQKNPKRKRDSGNAEADSDKTKATNLCLKERKHDILDHMKISMKLEFQMKIKSWMKIKLQIKISLKLEFQMKIKPWMMDEDKATDQDNQIILS
jgi:hypothetical protein